jgi:outer membrane protein TolC
MNKLAVIFFITFCSWAGVMAQTIDYNTIILPEKVKDLSVKEKLVQLAWQNNPETTISKNDLLISKKNITLTKTPWLDIFRVSGNLNEYTINPSAFEDALGNRFFPRYNISATVALGMFVETPTRTRIAKLEYTNQEQAINLQKLNIRASVLRLYEHYRRSRELYKVQTGMTQDTYSNYQIAEQQFKTGEITLEEYNQSLREYQQQMVMRIQRESEMEIAKINLEEVVGINLDDILEDYM